MGWGHAEGASFWDSEQASTSACVSIWFSRSGGRDGFVLGIQAPGPRPSQQPHRRPWLGSRPQAHRDNTFRDERKLNNFSSVVDGSCGAGRALSAGFLVGSSYTSWKVGTMISISQMRKLGQKVQCIQCFTAHEQ